VCFIYCLPEQTEPLSANINTELNSAGNTVSVVVDILQSPEEATKMLCPEESPRLSMIILMIYSSKMEYDDEYHRDCSNMFYKYFKDIEYIFIGYKSSR
jgi:hypothetical protein